MILPMMDVLNTLVAGCSRDENSMNGSNPGSQVYYGSMEYVSKPPLVYSPRMESGSDNIVFYSRSWEN